MSGFMPHDLDDCIMLLIMGVCLIIIACGMVIIAWEWVQRPAKRKVCRIITVSHNDGGCTVSPYIARHSGEDRHASR